MNYLNLQSVLICRQYSINQTYTQMDDVISKMEEQLEIFEGQENLNESQSVLLLNSIFHAHKGDKTSMKDSLLDQSKEPVQCPIVSSTLCGTQKLGKTVLAILKCAIEGHNLYFTTDNSIQKSIKVKQQIQIMHPIWDEYLGMPKCKICRQQRSRFERLLAQAFLKQWFNKNYSVDRQKYQQECESLFQRYFPYLLKCMKRVVLWCQNQSEAL